MYHLLHLINAHLIKFITAIFLFIGLSANAQFWMYSSHSVNDGKTTIKYSKSGFDKFSLKYEGEITISDDDKDIVAITDGGFFEIKKSVFGNKRKVVIESDNNGRLIKKYYTGFSQKEFEPEGRIWLSEILPNVVRSTNIGAKDRVERFYNRGGAQAVFDEVELLESDHVAHKYLKMVLEKDLSTGELESLLRLADKKISSDHHLAELLQHHQKDYFASNELTSAYINIAQCIDSDHYITQIVNRAIEDGDLSDNQIAQLFQIIDDMGSDHYIAQVLIEILEKRELNDNNLNLLVENIEEIDSDHYKADVLLTALKSTSLSPGNYYALIETVEDIDSDHHLAEVFKELVNQNLNSAELGKVLRLIGETIHSDHHLAEVLIKALDKQDLDEYNIVSFEEALYEIDSDHHLASVLSQLAKESLTDKQLITVLEATDEISSDNHLSSVLQDFAPLVNKAGKDVKQAYDDACESISSDAHYRAAIRAID